MLSGFALSLLLLQTAPAPGQLEYERGVELLQKGQAPQALQVLAKAVMDHPQTAALWRLYGVALAQNGDLLNATEAFNTACRLNPNVPDSCYYYGRALYSLNRFTEAIDVFKRSIRGDFVKGRSETALAEAYEALGQAREAEEYYRWAIARKDRSHERALLSYGRFLIRAGRTEEGMNPLKTALTLYPESSEAHFQMARILLQLDRPPEALPYAERALSLAAGNPQYRLLLARIYRRTGRDADAAKLEQQ